MILRISLKLRTTLWTFSKVVERNDSFASTSLRWACSSCVMPSSSSITGTRTPGLAEDAGPMPRRRPTSSRDPVCKVGARPLIALSARRSWASSTSVLTRNAKESMAFPSRVLATMFVMLA